jgi:hypothetical protein
MTQKITKEQQEALKEIEAYWRETIASQIFEASEKLKLDTPEEVFGVCENIARGTYV